MPFGYHLTEAFPKVPSTYAHTGRGGAGNIAKPRSNNNTATTTNSNNNTKYDNRNTALSRNANLVAIPDLSSAYPPPTSLSTSRKPIRQKTFAAGRGGIGNLHPASERAIFSFDEELERLRKAEDTIAPIYHIGRGGEGNLVDNRSRRFSSAESTTSGSISSRESESGFRTSMDRVRARFSRQQSGVIS